MAHQKDYMSKETFTLCTTLTPRIRISVGLADGRATRITCHKEHSFRAQLASRIRIRIGLERAAPPGLLAQQGLHIMQDWDYLGLLEVFFKGRAAT